MFKRVILAFLVFLAGPGSPSLGQHMVAEASGDVKERIARECNSMEGIIDRTICFAGKAREQGDFKICDLSSHEGVRFQCYAIFAEKVKDQNICFEIPPKSPDHRKLRDACLSDVAATLIDQDICGAIETPGLRDSCYFKIFKKTGDVSLCDMIEDPGLKSGCAKEPVYVR